MEIFYESTPNPNSMKFNTTQTICDGSYSFNSIDETKNSPLAQKIFGFPWASGVHIGPNFITVTKMDWVEWDVLADPLCDLISEHIASQLEVVTISKSEPTVTSEDPIIQKILTILDEEIRPAVAMDGGDIVFNKFENGILYLELMGACSGCPSSMITLKEGVETRIQSEIPEVKEVVSI